MPKSMIYSKQIMTTGETQDQELARLATEQKFDLPKNDIVEQNTEDLFQDDHHSLFQIGFIRCSLRKRNNLRLKSKASPFTGSYTL